ncbi:uncharacterized protein GGS25DRAFT_301087 [Hypoxylon fragiforme]|uniref:uncharacterized protein n=1 Tax=Hypoxylon fragiforme TaxID=63214 RepID=UPI0020C67B00|nr:uncharacterized protein GGS25DRAFT_301087 [Hypoxylon fragiforme]KAI2609033.1 hypothetical protein GGS25DRAFT_301087 [Hypoxylon fragiforme]
MSTYFTMLEFRGVKRQRLHLHFVYALHSLAALHHVKSSNNLNLTSGLGYLYLVSSTCIRPFFLFTCRSTSNNSHDGITIVFFSLLFSLLLSPSPLLFSVPTSNKSHPLKTSSKGASSESPTFRYWPSRSTSPVRRRRNTR